MLPLVSLMFGTSVAWISSSIIYFSRDLVPLVQKHIPHGELNKVNGNGLLKESVYQKHRNLMQHLKLLY